MAVNGIELAVGQKWKTRCGQEVEIVGYDDETATSYIWDLSDRSYVTDEGRQWDNEDETDSGDLITLIQDEHGFTPWNGGECPVPDHIEIEAKLRCGDLENEVAEWFNWSVSGGRGDIVAYRVVKQKEGKPKQMKEITVETATEPKEEPKYTVKEVFDAITAETAFTPFPSVEQVQKHLARLSDPDYNLYLQLKAKFE